MTVDPGVILTIPALLIYLLYLLVQLSHFCHISIHVSILMPMASPLKSTVNSDFVRSYNFAHKGAINTFHGAFVADQAKRNRK